MTERQRLFPDGFDHTFTVGSSPGNHAFFGRDVLRGLVEGIEDFLATKQPRWSEYREIGPVLLGCSPWIDDDKVLGALGGFAACCIVIGKQLRTPTNEAKLERLSAVNESTNGLPINPFSYLADLAPKEDGQPLVVGPYGPSFGDAVLPTIRTVGFRSLARGDYVPLVHAKLVLLGRLWWHDEGPAGPQEIEGFAPKRLWVSSANLTASSRRSLEFGYWTEDQELVNGAERFLLKLIATSEGLDPESNLIDPELAPVAFDDEAFWEAMADDQWHSDTDSVED